MNLQQLSEHLAEVDKTNEAFLAAPVAKKRTMLASDVLRQLHMGRLIPQSNYFSFIGMSTIKERGEDPDIRQTLRDVPQCSVCGIGALFVAAVERLNEIRFSAYFDSGYFRRCVTAYLGNQTQLFSLYELDRIENFFEDDDLPVSKRMRMQILMELIIRVDGRTLTASDFKDERARICG